MAWSALRLSALVAKQPVEGGAVDRAAGSGAGA